MSWQDELRSLDAELAEKRISPVEYRRRRDDLLAAASGRMPMSTTAPFPQRVAPGSQEPTGQASPQGIQAVPPWTPANQTQQYPAPQYPAPPGMDGDLMNIMVARTRRSKVGLVVALICVLVVAGLGAAGWWFGFGSRNAANTTAANTPPASTTPANTTAATSSPAASSPTNSANLRMIGLKDLPPLPGIPDAQNGEFTVADAAAKGLFDTRATALLNANKADRVVVSSTKNNGLGYAVIAVDVGTAPQADKAMHDLVDYQGPNGLMPTNLAGLPASVQIMKLVAPNQTQYMAIYASGRTVLIAAVTQPGKGSEPAVSVALHDLMTSLLAMVPAK
ncbi:MAG: hypothetical protein JOZ47_22780 [Kutzneria sp.]|nr:hypothetical protein [Kutzneria sp.]